MILSAVDTNVLLDLLTADPQFSEKSIEALEDSGAAGTLVICDIVYAELCVHFPSQAACDDFLDDNAIRVEGLTRSACFHASRIWKEYRNAGGSRSRILPDFLVGAHAQAQASRLVSRDRGFYSKLFPELIVIDPSARLKPPRKH